MIIRLFCPFSSGELACRGRGRDEVVTDLLRTTIRHYKQDCPPLSSGELACRGRGRDEVVTDLLRTTIRHYKQDCPPSPLENLPAEVGAGMRLNTASL